MEVSVPVTMKIFMARRNVYNGDPNVPISEIAAFVKYVRQTQHAFMEETDESLVSTCFILFLIDPVQMLK